MSRRSSSTQLNCFSPPVMVATFVVETVMAMYTVWRYKLEPITRLIVLSLLALGLFQLCEYNDCTGFGASATDWSRLGYATITTLPALGLHLLHRLAGKKESKLVYGAYVTMAGFIGYFLLMPNVFGGYQCTGNYVIFQLTQHASWAYSVYYYGWLFTTIGLGIRWGNKLAKEGSSVLLKLRTVQALIVGYLVFLVPTALANTIRPETRRGIPSIMCGFAVLFAFILTFYILPRRAELRDKALDKLAK